jgi:hypothetical protein
MNLHKKNWRARAPDFFYSFYNNICMIPYLKFYILCVLNSLRTVMLLCAQVMISKIPEVINIGTSEVI